MAELQRDLRRGRPVCAGRLLLWIVALLLAAQTAHAQGAPLFTFVQISDSQPVVAADQAIFEEVLDTVIAGGQSGALLPRAVDFVIIPGDLVDLASNTSEWVSFVDTVDTRLTAVGIPYLAVPGNHDIQGHGVGNYELYIADSGVWDSGIDVVAGHNGEVVALGWEGLRFIGFNSYNTGANEVSSADLAIIDQRVTDAGAASENAFLVAHYPHDGSSRMPLASILPDPNIVGYMRGHTNNAHAFSGLDGVSNPNAWDLNSNAIYRDGAILYYEVFANELQVHVIELLPSPPSSLPPPVTVPLVHTLRSVGPPVAPTADFSASPQSGAAPLEVTFIDQSLDSPTSWLWDFGDGNGSSEQHPVHTYTVAGTYDVSLTVTNSAGSDTLTDVALISVSPPLPMTTYTPVADAHVKDSSPSNNYGGLDHVRVRGGAPDYEGYLKFDVAGLASSAVQSATLRLYVNDASPDGGTLYEAASTSWTESGITWNSAPGPTGAPLASMGETMVGSWAEFDVSALVTGDGTYAFMLDSGSTNSSYYSSREGTNAPELVVLSAAAEAPVADFSGTPVAGTAPLTVDFSDLSSGPPESWSWSFGDGGTSTEANPSHTYDAAGVYTVTLTVSNGLGSDTRTRTSYVSVDPPVSPVADFSADVTSGSAPLDVVFTDLSTGNPASWAWDFGDGNGSSEPNPSHRYAAAGTYDVSLTVTNSADSDTLTRVGYVSVAPPPPVTTHLPVADAHVRDSSPNNNYGSLDHLRGRAGTSSYRGHLQFDVTGLAGSSVESATLRLFVTDGSVDGGTFYEAASTGWSESGITWNNAPAPSGAALGSAGSVNVGSWVEIDVTPAVEGDGLHAFLFTSGSSNSVYYASRETANPPELVIEAAAAAPPVAGFSATPLTGTAPLTVDFSDLSSGPPTSWLWTFGDGNTSTEANPSHTYAAAGPYDVTLTVTNGLGADTLSRTGYVSVSPPVPPTADFSADVTSGTTPLDVQFSDLSTGNPASWLWDFGDGNGSSDPNPSHTYAGAGTYDVSLTVTNPADSDTLTRVGYISVSLPPPVTTHFPVADAHVRDKNANRNYGGEDHLRLRGGSPNYQAYLKFDVSGSGGSVASAVLRLYVTDASVDGGTVYEAASTSWTESGINWNNAPGSVGAPLASAGPVAVDTWVEYDVTGLVTGDGTWALLVTSDSTNSTFFSSREGAQSPELVIESN